MALGLAACTALGNASIAAARTLRVTTTRDELASPDGRCSLRQAISAVDAPGTRTACGTAGQAGNTILLPAGRYRLSLAPSQGDDNASGDLNVTTGAPLTITGRGTNATVIDASGLGDRVLSLATGARVTLHRLRITGGLPPPAAPGIPGLDGVSCDLGGAGGHGYDVGPGGEGGGIYNAGTLTLDRVVVIGNTAARGGAGGRGGAPDQSSGCAGGNGGQGAAGGGIYNRGTLALRGATIAANTAGSGGPGGSSGGAGAPGGGGGPGGNGGGIYNQGQLSVAASAIYDNRSGAGGLGGGGTSRGQGIDAAGGPGGLGGGIFSTDGGLRVINSTLVSNFAGPGGTGGGLTGSGGRGGSGGGMAVVTGPSLVGNATLSGNGVGEGGAGGSSGGRRGSGGQGGGLFVQSLTTADNMRLQNTIVASSRGSGCAGSGRAAITNGGHDLSYGDTTCPGRNGDPRLGSLNYNGGPTPTLALGRGSSAVGRVPGTGGHCPARDQRGVLRPIGRACDIGAYQHSLPTITFISPAPHGSYRRGSRLVARFRCSEGGTTSLIVTCHGSVPAGQKISTARASTGRVAVTATDRSGHRITRTIAFSIWTYVNPLREIRSLRRERIDMGVDYGGSGPLLALGRGRVTVASNHAGPSRCRGITCWIGGGAVIYRLLDGPFAGRSVYIAENITVTARVGQLVRAGQRIAILHPAQPNMETGWASGHGPQTLAIADGHQCPCGDPGGWSTIEGRNFDLLLARLGAPSGHLQPNPPDQTMPRGWPVWR